MSWRKRIAMACGLALVAVLLSSPLWLRPEPADPSFERQLPELVDNEAPQRAFPRLRARVLDAEGFPAPDELIYLEAEGLKVHSLTDEEGWVEDQGHAISWPLEVQPRRRTEPRKALLEGPEDSAVFRFIDPCPVELQVREGPPEAWLELATAEAAWSAELEGGRVQLEMPCESVRVDAFAEGYVSATELVAAQFYGRWSIDFSHGLRIYGTVRDTEGEPVESVRVHASGQDHDVSASDGRYEIFVARTGLHVLQIDDGHYEPDHELVRLPEGELEVQHDLVVQAAHRVVVRCAGLEGDSCAWIPWIQCTQPELPVGTLCEERGADVVCRCPQGEVAVRGGGQAVLVGPEDDIAWLDFRDEGALAGRVLVDGEPSRCKLSASRGLGVGLSGLSLRVESCDETGEFLLDNLEPGLWRLEVEAEGVKKSVGPLQVQGLEELGDIELLDGTVVYGRVLDELSGEPVEGVAVAAVVVSDGRPGGASGGRSDADGRYAIRGLEPGEVQVFLPSSPLRRQSGQLVQELEVDLVHSPPGEVSTERLRGGGLRVTALGPSAPEGLEVGDRLESVRLFGLDPLDYAPQLEGLLMEPLLRAAGLPGVELSVRRDGELVELD